MGAFFKTGVNHFRHFDNDQVSGSNVIDTEFTADKYRLKGTLYRPSQAESGAIIGCHGLLSDRTSPKQQVLARRCNQLGLAYFAFDHRGCGDSQGVFDKVTNLKGRISDLLAAVRLIRAKTGFTNRLGLFGSSMGGTVCLAAAHEINPMAIVTVAAPLKSASIVRTEQNAIDTGRFSDAFYQERLQFDITNRIAGISHLLVFHGDGDETVPVSHGRTIYGLADDPKKIIIQKGGDHRMSRTEHQEAFIYHAAYWYGTYLVKRGHGN